MRGGVPLEQTSTPWPIFWAIRPFCPPATLLPSCDKAGDSFPLRKSYRRLSLAFKKGGGCAAGKDHSFFSAAPNAPAVADLSHRQHIVVPFMQTIRSVSSDTFFAP